MPDTTPPSPTHRCPGCDLPGVPHHHVACRACWRLLPKYLSLPFRNVRMGTAAHRAVLGNALAWFRRHRTDLELSRQQRDAP
jgi:hypothetical protein